MANNSPQQIRKKLYEEYEDSLFRLVMHDAGQHEGKLFLEEKEILNNDPESLPSEEAFQRFSQQLEAHLKKRRANIEKRHILKVITRSAVIILVVMVLSLTAVASVQALRVRVLNLLLDIQPKYTSFQLKESGSSLGGGSPVVDWTKTYVPTYIPDGYQISNIANGDLFKKIVFENQDKDSLITYMELSEGNNPAVDTENASVFKPISINGHEGTLVVKNSMVTIVWEMDNYIFIIQTQTREEIAVKIAEGVKYIE